MPEDDRGVSATGMKSPGPNASEASDPAICKSHARAIIVLGMHRSGTSAITGALRLCGAWIGEDQALTGSNSENPKGFWERRDMRNICDALLHSAGADWWKVAGFEADAVPHAVVEEQCGKFRTVAGDLNTHGVWAIKEPRLSLLFPILKSLMPDPVCVLPYRHPLEVARSLRWRNGFGIAEGLALWEAYTRSALRVSRDVPRFLISYERLVSDPHVELRRIHDRLMEFGVAGISMPKPADIGAFLTSSLRRQRIDGVDAMAFLLPSQRELWEQLESGEALEHGYAEPLSPVTRQHLQDLESFVVSKNLKAKADKALADLAEMASIKKERDRAVARAAAAEEDLSDALEAVDAERTRVARLEAAFFAQLGVAQQELKAAQSASRKDSELKLHMLERIKVLEQELAKAKTARKRLLASTSWKITKPLRGAKRVAGLLTDASGKSQIVKPLRSIKRLTARVISRAKKNTKIPPKLVLSRPANGNSPGLAIVIPVYNAPQEVRACLHAVVDHTPRDVRVIVIDDASPDAAISPILQGFSDIENIEIYQNNENLGFTRTVNRGIQLAKDRDVVFLNSDTRVTAGWTRRLTIAAYSAPDIGTVTPLSNNAGPFSVPEVGENAVPDIGLDAFASVLNRTSQRLYPETPTGHGFCLYVRRDCLNAVGLLDESAFPRGYGEENDFCMRAGKQGWRHIIDDSTYIFHVRTASFASAKTELITAGRAVIDRRYPDYTQRVRAFVKGDALASVRDQAQQALAAHDVSLDGDKRRILFVLPKLGARGGTPQTNRDLMLAISETVQPFLLVCDGREVRLHLVTKQGDRLLEKATLSAPIKAFPHRSDDYDATVADWCVRYGIQIVHYRHLALHSIGLVPHLKALRIPRILSLHDFYSVCPTVKLLDNNMRYCGGSCTAGPGQCKYDLWKDPSLPELKGNAIHDWQRMMSATISDFDVLVTTSDYARSVIAKRLPEARQKEFHVIPHGRDFPSMRPPSVASYDGGILRVLVPGRINAAKGGLLLREAAKKLQGRVEFHLLGTLGAVGSIPGLVQHGAYDRDKFVSRVQAIKGPVHVGAVLSIWPETYCHTLTELWAAGLPVVGVDLGAVGERIRESGAGWLVTRPDVNDIVEVFQSIIDNPQSISERNTAVAQWQNTIGKEYNTARMASCYMPIYDGILQPKSEEAARLAVSR